MIESAHQPATIGKINRIWRYPVKSMSGELCRTISITLRGLEGDRLYAIRTKDGKLGSGKNTHHFKRIDGLLEFRAVHEYGRLVIHFPDRTSLFSDDSRIHEALSDALRQHVTLVREEEQSHFDSRPIHILTTASLNWLRRSLSDAQTDERRFRPNIVIDIPGDKPFELDWPGKVIRVGNHVLLRAAKPTARCVMVNLAQPGLSFENRVLKTIAKNSANNFGIYAEVVDSGRISNGNMVEIFSMS